MALAAANSAPSAAPPTLEPTAVDAPHLLPRYVEPKPFVSPRSARAFGAAAIVAFGCAAGFYRLLAKSLTTTDVEQERALNALKPAAVIANGRQGDVSHFGGIAPEIPKFVSPTSFAQLATLPETDFTVQRSNVSATRSRPLLHQEAITRIRVTWNSCVDAAIDFVVQLEKQRTDYLHAHAVAGIQTHLNRYHPGYSFVLNERVN